MVHVLQKPSTMDREISECGVASMALASTCDKIAIDWNGWLGEACSHRWIRVYAEARLKGQLNCVKVNFGNRYYLLWRVLERSQHCSCCMLQHC